MEKRMISTTEKYFHSLNKIDRDAYLAVFS
jgi:hypothetical protein